METWKPRVSVLHLNHSIFECCGSKQIHFTGKFTVLREKMEDLLCLWQKIALDLEKYNKDLALIFS